MEPRPIYLAGEWKRTKNVKDIVDPWNGKVVAKVCFATPKEVERAIAIASSSFKTVSRTPAHIRSESLCKIADGLSKRKEELANSIVSENGKPYRDSMAEAERAVTTFTIASAEATRIEGEVMPLDAVPRGVGRVGIVRRFPIGPIVGISPFNFPLNLVAHKVAPAIASGNPIIIKPASKTPMTALLLAEIAHEAGLPKGLLSVLPCESKLAAPLVEDGRVKMVTFTGSAEIGWDIKSRCGMKRTTLELGGNAAVIVHDDADISHAAERCCAGAFAYAGQVCISVQRIFVQRRVFGPFCERLVELTSKLKVGDPHDHATDVGPMLDDENAERIEAWVDEAKAKGARVLCGGERRGRLYHPTVLTRVPKHLSLCAKEAFGPIVVVERYEKFPAAIEMVNDSVYGLQAGVFTSDVGRVMHAFKEIDVGGVIANDVPTFRADNMPYGGVKASGFGREGVKFAIQEMTETKILVLPE